MYKFINSAANRFEEHAPKLTITGVKITTVCIIIAIISLLEVMIIDSGIGRIGARVGVMGGVFGVFLAFMGKWKRDLGYEKYGKSENNENK